MPKGVKGYQKGDDWNGNSKGAPKKQFRRDEFTDEFFVEQKQRIYNINLSVLDDAEGGDKRSKALVWQTFLTKPPNRDEPVSDTHSKASETLSGCATEALAQMRGILLQQMKTKDDG